MEYCPQTLMSFIKPVSKVSVLSKGISYIAGYNLRMLPIIQSPKQLVEVYGEDVAQTFTTTGMPAAQQDAIMARVDQNIANNMELDIAKKNSQQGVSI